MIMAVQSPIAGSRFDNVDGNKREVAAKFASVATGDTWASGLAIITDCEVQSGAAKVMGATVSGGNVTITVTAGPDTNTFVRVAGY